MFSLGNIDNFAHQIYPKFIFTFFANNEKLLIQYTINLKPSLSYELITRESPKTFTLITKFFKHYYNIKI